MDERLLKLMDHRPNAGLPGELATVDELSREYKVPRSFFYTPGRRKGPDAVPCLRIGRYLRYDRRAVREYFLKRSKGQG